MTYTITQNAQFNSLEIAFDGKPDQATREALKALRFRWHGMKKSGTATQPKKKPGQPSKASPPRHRRPKPRRPPPQPLRIISGFTGTVSRSTAAS